MFFSSTKIAAVVAGALTLVAVPAAAATETTTYLQFFQANNNKVLNVSRVAGVTTFSASGALVDARVQAFHPDAPFLEQVSFSFSASSSESREIVGDGFQVQGFTGVLSFTTADNRNLLTLQFNDALSASFDGSDAGTFSSAMPPAVFNFSSDIIDVSNFVGGNFSLAISGLSSPIIDGDYSINGNIAGTFAAATQAVVPEPAAWALMISGFGMVGFAARRRRARRVVAA